MTDDGGDGRPQSLSGWFSRVTEHVREVVHERVDEFARKAAQILHDEFERVIVRAEDRLRRAAIFGGVLAVGVGLLAVGVAGAVGEWLGRPWLGQLVVGAILVVIAAIWLAGRASAKRREKREKREN
jgi:ABC-type phosphate/phosphonate transport system permease subunit